MVLKLKIVPRFFFLDISFKSNFLERFFWEEFLGQSYFLILKERLKVSSEKLSDDMVFFSAACMLAKRKETLPASRRARGERGTWEREWDDACIFESWA